MSPDVNNPGYRAVTFDELRLAYGEQLRGLIDGGADIILIETIFDTLNAKAAIFACNEIFIEKGVHLPVMISGTITDLSGRTPVGPDADGVLALGAPCRAADDRPQLRARRQRDARHLRRNISAPQTPCVCAYPNAGLPNEFGRYDETPGLHGRADRGFCTRGPGQCRRRLLRLDAGPYPRHRRGGEEHIASRAIPEIERKMRLSGLEPFTLTDEIPFVNVGERTNVTGSAKFRKLITAGDYVPALDVARDQVANGAQIIDINMDEGLIDSKKAMVDYLNLIAAEPDIARVPVMVDSSKWEVIEARLEMRRRASRWSIPSR